MRFLGDNTAFGAERVDLGAERHADPAVEEGEAFPCGVRGLVPVHTARRKKGGVKTVYAFPFGEGEPPADDPLAQELCAAVDFVNVLLGEAEDLTGRPFGVLGAVWMGIAPKGYSFTRVEKIDSQGPNALPIHLRVETSDVPAEPGTLSAVLQYDADGRLRHALLTEYGEDGYTCFVTAAEEYATGEVLVERVVEGYPDEEPRELFRRRHAAPERRYDGDGRGRTRRR